MRCIVVLAVGMYIPLFSPFARSRVGLPFVGFGYPWADKRKPPRLVSLLSEGVFSFLRLFHCTRSRRRCQGFFPEALPLWGRGGGKCWRLHHKAGFREWDGLPAGGGSLSEALGAGAGRRQRAHDRTRGRQFFGFGTSIDFNFF